MCDIQNNGKIQREFETRSTDDQPTIQWLPVVGSWTFLGVNMHFNEKLFMCDSCNFLVRAYREDPSRGLLCDYEPSDGTFSSTIIFTFVVW